MKERDLLIGVLTKTHTKTEDELNNIIYDDKGSIRPDALDALLNTNAEKVKRIQSDAIETGFNNGYKKGTAESLSDLEKRFKDKFGFSSENKGLDLFEEWAAKTAKSNLTVDDVRKHPAFLELEKNSVNRAEYENVKKEYDTFRTNLERQKVMDRVSKKALNVLDKLDPVIEDNPTVARKRREIFLNEFSKFDYEFDGDFIIPMKDGKRVVDKHGNALGFETLTKDIGSEHFVFNKQSYKQNSGNDGGSSTVSVDVPRNKEEYLRKIAAEKDPQKRIAYMKAFKEASK
jgi:hypothetical protein